VTSVDLVCASIKPTVKTFELSKDIPNFDNVIVVKNVFGLGVAHNECFRKSNSDLVILVADDVVIDSKVWSFALDVKRGEFAMLDTGDFGITGVFSIYRKDFWGLGGFDESLKYGNVDREFFCRAMLSGLKFKKIPLSLVKHIRHETRCSTIYKSFNVMRDATFCVKKYFVHFPRDFFVHDFLYPFMRGKFRAILLSFLFFYRYTLFGWVDKLGDVLLEDLVNEGACC